MNETVLAAEGCCDLCKKPETKYSCAVIDVYQNLEHCLIAACDECLDNKIMPALQRLGIPMGHDIHMDAKHWYVKHTTFEETGENLSLYERIKALEAENEILRMKSIG